MSECTCSTKMPCKVLYNHANVHPEPFFVALFNENVQLCCHIVAGLAFASLLDKTSLPYQGRIICCHTCCHIFHCFSKHSRLLHLSLYPAWCTCVPPSLHPSKPSVHQDSLHRFNEVSNSMNWGYLEVWARYSKEPCLRHDPPSVMDMLGYCIRFQVGSTVLPQQCQPSSLLITWPKYGVTFS
jgi:hypothetical protein